MPFTPSLSCGLPSLPPHCSIRNNNKTSKQSDRLLSSLASSSDPSAADRIIRKFVASSSKSTSLDTLSLFLSRSSLLALPIYRTISTAPWFKWSPKLAADVISLLESNGRFSEAELLVSESISKLNSPKDVAHFYCDLVDAASDRGLNHLVLEASSRVQETGFMGKRRFESMIRGLSLIGMPVDAEKVFDEMQRLGFKPSGFECRMLVQGYGRLGLFNEMRRVLCESEVDTVCANVVLSCYGEHRKLPEMLAWLREMRASGVGYSARTFNCVLNSCAGLVSIVQDLASPPLCIGELVERLDDKEALLVRELVDSTVLVANLKWSCSEGELELHGFHLTSAYVVLLQWLEELKCSFRGGEEAVVPLEISVVCGSGKHSVVRGESPLRRLVQELMSRLKSPMKIDRKNAGRFVAKGKAVRDWLC